MKVEIPSQALTCRNLVGGAWVSPSASGSLPVVSPYNGSTIGSVPLSDQSAVTSAVKAAAAAFPGWRQTPLKERCALLFRFRELVRADLDSLAHLVASESGKTFDEAREGIRKGLEVTEFALSIQNLDVGGALEVSRGVTCELRREPLGVVVGIAPFNFPAMVPMWMYPIALTLGNCFILKPSEKVSLSSQRFGELIVSAGFPPGVFSVVNGGQNTVEALVDAPEVRAVGFVGSTPAALAVYQRATRLGKRALCLGGAKNSVIIVPDADPAVTLPGVVASFTGCAGQRCMAASLLIAVGEVDQLLAAIVERARSLTLGRDMGAIISAEARQRIVGIISAAAEHGARLPLDGRNTPAPQGYEGGFWLGPTIIDNVQPDSPAATTEIFGPVLTVVRARDLSHALEIEAALPYGNATSVFTTRGSIARRVAEQATSGMVGVNVGVPVPREPFSFGGTKRSKFGAGDITGVPALDFWSERKKITTKWEAQRDTTWMG